jgi:hypothetical protein
MLDIRVTNDARFMDQKVTTDVLCIISDCVINYLEQCDTKEHEFTVNDIWGFDYFNDNVKVLFSKPDVNEETASCEYDKFIGQPLKMLSYAGILGCVKRGRANYFKVKEYKLLEYISTRERNAFDFLVQYIENVLEQSGLLSHFESFKDNNTKDEFFKLKDTYIRFIIEYTKINGSVEASRIFTKVINPYAVHHGIRGTEKGRISEQKLSFSDLLYNRRNWRDIDKEKQETRQMHKQQSCENYDEAVNNYYIEKAKRTIKRLHTVSEVKDEYSVGPATHTHHIFMKSEFPIIASFLENLILLTPTQHLGKAHPNNNTSEIDRQYQLTCLLAKSDTIQKHLLNEEFIEKIYDKGKFIEVINTGLYTQLNKEVTFVDITHKLVELYR